MKSGDIAKLLNASAFPHPVEKLDLIETHISWVILTGEFAYKIKKPVDLGFVNFTSLERRKHFCDEELRLNRRTAPDLYLAVVPIAETAQGLKFGDEPATEYAVKMRQFPVDARLDHRLQAGLINTDDVLAMAAVIADFHGSLTPKADADTKAEMARTGRYALDNFDQIRDTIGRECFSPLLSGLDAWTRQQMQLLGPVFEDRVTGGFIREGHGDLHLSNMLRLQGRILLFDCLEFDPAMRWLDLMNDIAFLVMDLMAHQREDLAFVLLNRYLERTGDYPGISVLRFYLVYRSLVRAKVAAMQPGNYSPVAVNQPNEKTRAYLELARSLANQPASPSLFLLHGFSGAGKSWLSAQLLAALPAIRVRSDLERKRSQGLASGQQSGSGIDTGLYAKEVTELTYALLARHCETGLRAGFHMIADASFLRHAQRRRFLDLAAQLDVPAFILDCTCPNNVLRNRIRNREKDPQRVSEAGLAVLDHQLAHHDPITGPEMQHVVRIDMGGSPAITDLLQQLRKQPGC